MSDPRNSDAEEFRVGPGKLIFFEGLLFQLKLVLLASCSVLAFFISIKTVTCCGLEGWFLCGTITVQSGCTQCL